VFARGTLTFDLFFASSSQIIVAISPLLALGYVLFMAFENDEEEGKKRSKKSDFNLEGHAE
jgi:hypothetical protein